MASGDGDGIVWVCLIGLAVWAWDDNRKLKAEKVERIDAVQEAYEGVSALQLRVTELERQVEFAEGLAKDVATSHESLRNTFNGNVDIENRAKVARLTEQGACGTETEYLKSGGWIVRNKECTLKDLK